MEAYYTLPRNRWDNREVRFSPSGLGKCDRELYFMNIGASPDGEETPVAWRARVPRNGTGVHEVTQADYKEMYTRLTDAGQEPRFWVKDTEVSARKAIDVDGATVVLSGRCDVKLWDSLLEHDTLLELKTMDKRTNWQKIKEPKPDHQLQAIAYSILFGIPRCIFSYEVLQKPQWMKIEENDLKHYYFETTPEMERSLLARLSGVVRAIEAREAPPKDLTKCFFCAYKTTCQDMD